MPVPLKKRKSLIDHPLHDKRGKKQRSFEYESLGLLIEDRGTFGSNQQRARRVLFAKNRKNRATIGRNHNVQYVTFAKNGLYRASIGKRSALRGGHKRARHQGIGKQCKRRNTKKETASNIVVTKSHPQLEKKKPAPLWRYRVRVIYTHVPRRQESKDLHLLTTRWRNTT